MEKLIIRSTTAPVGRYARLNPRGPVGKPTHLPKPDDGHHHDYPRLSDPEDVAARIAESWERELAAKGGPRRDFAESVRARLRHWAAGGVGGSRLKFEQRFRGEVARQVRARLAAWVRDGGGDSGNAPEWPGVFPLTC
jgi:hypothetical protein